MPVSLKARPYLALRIAFDFKNFVFRAFVLIFFLRTCLRHRYQSALAPTGVAFCEKKEKTVGILARGPDRRGLCFHPGIS